MFASFLLSSSVSNAQERITSIYDIGDNQRYILKEIDGQKYMLIIDKFDMLKVYQFNGDNLEFQHAQKFEGLQFDYDYYMTDHFLVFQNNEGGIAYNFVSNETKYFPFPEGFNSNTWLSHSSYGDEIVLTQSIKNFTERESKYIDLNTNEELNLDYGFSYRITDEYIYLLEPPNNSFSNHIFIDKKTFEIDSISLFDVDFRETVVQGERQLYVLGNELRIRDIKSQTDELLYAIPELFNFARIESIQDHYALILNLPNFTEEITLIDKENLQVQNTISIDKVDNLYPRIIDSKLIFHHGTDIYIYDLITEENTVLNTSSSGIENFEIVDDQYLIFSGREWSPIEILRTIGLYDLKSESTILLEPIIGSPYTRTDVLKIADNKLLVNYDDDEDDKTNLFEINLDQFTAAPSTKYSSVYNGMSSESFVFKVAEDVLLYSKDLHYISEEGVVQLNIDPISEIDYEPFKIFEDHITG